MLSITPLTDATDQDPDDLPPLPDTILPTVTDAAPSVSLAGLRKVYHPKRSAHDSQGKNMLQQMDEDKYANIRQESRNVHFPFASRSEWQLANWLTRSSLPQTEIDSFLHLNWVCDTLIMFHLYHLILYTGEGTHA